MSSIKDIRENVSVRLRDLDQQLAELQRERVALSEVLATLDKASGTSRSQRPRARTTTNAGARSATSAGKRAAQAVEIIGKRPGIAVKDIAAELGINVNYLYRVLPRLEREGRITKQGTGYVPAPAKR